MENFSEICCQMLQEFRALLQHSAIGPTRLLQLAAINMFAIENTALQGKDSEKISTDTISLGRLSLSQISLKVYTQ